MSTADCRRRPRSCIENGDDADAIRRDGCRFPDSADIFKRLRLRGGGQDDASVEGDEEKGVEFSEPRVKSRVSAVDNGIAGPGFQPGAILRVTVENFVTYEHADFFPGPNLNMVIGPNGTGKSSLVCAICLGLGYPSSVLGRASTFGEFVKHGKDHAVIEIELQKRPDASRNSVVRLRITKEDNSRKFWINGKESTHKGVQRLTQSLRIQIDNLCQFLPQDKVAEFAGLNSVDLLTKTLQAAAPPEMLEWQEKLKELFAMQRDIEARLTVDAEELNRLEVRQESLQADVEKIREREKIQHAIEELRMVRLVVVYEEARMQHSNAKERKKAAQLKLRRLQESSEPSLRAVNAKEEYLSRIEQVLQSRLEALRKAEAQADTVSGEIEALDTKLQDLANTADAESNAYQTKRRELAAIRRKITELEASYRQAPREFNAAEWNTKIREQEHLQRENASERREVAEEMQKIRTLGNERQQVARKVANDLRELDSQQGQLMTQLKRLNPDAARAWEWIKQNQNQFEKEVFGPPMLCCTVKDQRYADLVQSVLSPDDFFCFTTQTREDHTKLSDKLYREMSLSVTVRTCLTPFDSIRPPLPREDLRKLGLDGYIIDYLEGPEPVLAMLCAEKRMHSSAVSLEDVSEEQYEQILASGVINQFAAGRQSYRVTRRKEYGPLATSTRVRQVDRGRFWTDQPLDVAEKTELRQKLDEAKAEIEELKDQLNALKEKEENLNQANTEIRETLNELRKQKSELQREYNMWLALPDKIELEKKTLEEKRQDLQETRSRIVTIEDQRDKVVIQKATLVLRYKDAVSAIRAAHLALTEARIRLVEATSEVEHLKEENAAIHQQLEEEKLALREVERTLTELKATAQRALADAQRIPEESRAMLIEIGRGKTVQDVDNDIQAEMTRLDVIEAGNPHALQEFEKRAVEIEKLKREKTRRQEDLRNLAKEIAELREKWEPRLDELVGRINDAFSYNFEQISCAGEVGVHKDDDFDKWAIEIKVKFRENETLQKLDQHRQSGGERAVSTIFYLMSLQSMAQAPFRVVDEINQGMDPRNERMVHERMVEIACREHTSQYFLITPKLLPGLRYDERMRVLCIASGEHMPSDGSKLDFGRCVKIQRRLMATAGA
ncbi:hypothetical protein VTK73DRAFT_8969 [Phialemonium thermophilum]|uniref:Structural maintenance of chromosomes protein 5 n=1 Tax=Phialemonium thermophilum TaxID=223376 RepID=A0ABR3Y6C1_9PEZI